MEALIAAVEQDKPRAAHQLLDSSQRSRLSEDDFVARWRTLRPELMDQAQALRTALARPMRVTARLDYGGGLGPRLVQADGAWKIQEDATALRALTPEDALRQLILALDQQDYPALVKVLSTSARSSLEDRLRKLKRSIQQPIEVTGSRARLQYDPQYKLTFIKEDGQWKIESLE